MDRLTEYAVKSLARHIAVNTSGLNSAIVIQNDTDWDRYPDPSDPGNKTLKRALPFAGIVLKRNLDEPFSIGNILYSHEILVQVDICASSYTQLAQITPDVRQVLRTAVNTPNSAIGIPLFNYAVVSGSYFDIAGTMQLDVGATEYFAAERETDQGNRKFYSTTLIEMNAFKDSTATLLENKGRISINDS